MKILLNNRLKENLANIITVAGLIGAIWFLILTVNNPDQLWLIFLLALAIALTDFIDGRIARSLDAESGFGSFSDRLRDRVFVYPALLILTWHHRWKLTNLPFPIITNTFTKAAVIGILIMEVLIFIAWLVGIIWFIRGIKINLKPSDPWGKKKTFSGFAVILIWLLSLTIENYLGFPLIKFSIFVIDFGLILMTYWAYKCLIEYVDRTKK